MSELKYAERVMKIIRKYFFFFDLPDVVPHKWVKHILKHINHFFEQREDIEDIIAEKEGLLNSLNIDDILSYITQMTDDLNQSASDLENQDDIYKSNQKALEKNIDSFENALSDILTDQENYNWFVWDESLNRIVSPVCYFSKSETEGYSNNTLTVNTNKNETSYKDGVLTLPNKVESEVK